MEGDCPNTLLLVRQVTRSEVLVAEADERLGNPPAVRLSMNLLWLETRLEYP